MVAEPGVGKTNLIHKLYYDVKVSLANSIYGDRITIATGMSSIDWIEQTSDGTKLRNTTTINGMSNQNIAEDIYHGPTFGKRIKYLLAEHPELLSEHLFIIDECHIACETENTISKYFDLIGLDSETMNKLKIKIILISATPDIVQSELINKIDSKWQFVKLKPGKNYKGFKYFRDQKMIIDYNIIKNKNIEQIHNIIKEYTEPKYHIIRIRGKSNNEFIKNIKIISLSNNYKILEHNQKERIENFDNMILNKNPDVHTFVFIKEFYKASKRLRLSEYLGLIIEPSSLIQDVTITAQGLIPKIFWIL